VNCAVSTSARRLRRLAALAVTPFYSVKYGIERIGPGYFVRTTIDAQSVVLDCGLGNNADFSDAIITRFAARCHGVDPTRKHQASLRAVASRHGDRLQLCPVALAGVSGTAIFYEAMDQISGSLSARHVNAKSAICYPVRCLSLEDLMAEIGLSRIDLLKLDIEGAEYEVLASIGDEKLAGIGQIVVEFHHYCVQGLLAQHTRNMVIRLKRLGFQSYTVDAINYLFFR
jgi:FkbM family methyltransferase